MFLSATWTVADIVPIHEKGEKNLDFLDHCSTIQLMDVLSCLDLKAKVGASRCDFFFFSFLKLGGI